MLHCDPIPGVGRNCGCAFTRMLVGCIHSCCCRAAWGFGGGYCVSDKSELVFSGKRRMGPIKQACSSVRVPCSHRVNRPLGVAG
jgi:hypothetical protein